LTRAFAANVNVTVVRIANKAVSALLQFAVEFIEHEVTKQWRDYSPYAKGNFTFDRVICGWGRGLTVLDLRLKR
jgi:hypothetical protein